jgi:protocatechuate 3,4-dioxygenase beta subunit
VSKGLGFAVAGLAAAAVVAGVILLSGEGREPGSGAAATVPTSRSEADTAPGFAADTAAATAPDAAPLAAAPAELAGSTTEAPAAAGKPKAARPRGEPVTLTGRVLDEAARPVVGARVTYVSDPLAFGIGRSLRFSRSADELPPPPEAETGRDGRFTLTGELPPPTEEEGLPFGSAMPQIVVQQDAFATLVQPLAGLAAPSHDTGDLMLAAGTWITGRAVDETGRPLAGAHVSATHAADSHSHAMGLPFVGGLADGLDRVITGADGRFRVAGLSPGKADVTVRTEGRRVGTVLDVALQARTPADVGDVALLSGETIAGVVTDREGQPLADADVSLSSMARLVVNRIEDLPRAGLGQDFGQRTRTGPDGRFEVSGLAGGVYTVHVRADGFERLAAEDVAAGTRDLRLVPVRLGGLFVQIVNDTDGAPVSGARIKATAVERADRFGARFGGDDLLPVLAGAEALAAAGRQGDPAGAYFVRNAPRDGMRLVVAADGFATLEAEGPAVEPAAIGSTSVRLVPESVVAGRVVRADDTPVAAARITLAVRKAPEAEDGQFVIGGQRNIRRSLRLGDTPPEAELDAARLTTKTHADGSFELRGVAPGDWELTAQHPDHVDSTALPLTLAAGQSQRDVQVTLQPAGAIIGLVTEADGTPAADIEVTVTPSADAGGGADSVAEDVAVKIGRMLQIDDGTSNRYARTEADGTYRVGGLAEGDYQVTLSGGARSGRRMGGMAFVMAGDRGPAQGAQSAWAKVVAGGEARADFTRPRRGSVSGRVVAGGRPMPDVSVRLSSKPEPGAFSIPGFGGGDEAHTDDRGAFRFDDVEAGKYELSAHVPGAALERRVDVAVEPGGASSSDLVFGGSTLSGRVVDKASDAGVPGVTLTVVPVKESDGDEPTAQFSFAMIAVDDSGGSGGMSMEIGGGSVSQVRSGEDGRFELLYLEPGTYRIEASGAGYIRAEIGPLDVAEGQNKDDLRLPVARGAVVHGRVLSDQSGQQLDSVPVRIEGGGNRQMTVTDKGGTYRFEGLEPGKYTVSVLGSGFGGEFGLGGSSLASEQVELELGQVRELDLRTKS